MRRVVEEEGLLLVAVDEVDGEGVDDVGAVHGLVGLHLLAHRVLPE